jgi:MFS family permease
VPSPSRHQSRSISAFITTEFLAGAARLVVATAVGKELYDITHSALYLGWLGLIEFAPSALLVLITGTLADRVDRRRIVAWAVALDAVGAALLAWHSAIGSNNVAVPLIVVGLIGVGRAFFTPALRALPADIVAAERVPWLVTRYSITWQASMIIGPVAGGFLYAAAPTLAYVVAAVAYGVGALVIPIVRFWHSGSAPLVSKEPKEKAGLHEALEGFRFVRRERVLLGAISLDLFAVLFGGAVALLPAIAEVRLHVGAVGLGWLRAANGIGASLVTATLVFKPVQRFIGRTLLGVVALFGIFTIVLGVTTDFVVAFIAILILAGADAISVFIRSTLVPLVTPPSKRGRVLALESVFIGASNELGAFESGVAAQLMGTATSVVFGGGMTLAVAVLWIFLFPGLRDQDRFPTEDAVDTRYLEDEVLST